MAVHTTHSHRPYAPLSLPMQVRLGRTNACEILDGILTKNMEGESTRSAAVITATLR